MAHEDTRLDTASSWCAAAVYDSGTDAVLAEISENIGKGTCRESDGLYRASNDAIRNCWPSDRVAVSRRSRFFYRRADRGVGRTRFHCMIVRLSWHWARLMLRLKLR